jgi:hypothetical protein
MGHVGELEVVDVQQVAVVFLALLVDLGVRMRGHVLQHGCLLLLRAADSHTLPGRNYAGPKAQKVAIILKPPSNTGQDPERERLERQVKNKTGTSTYTIIYVPTTNQDNAV